ncbi:MAG: Beta-ketoadipate enol-lactone hydrolase [uncultured Solirubrobacterales bacterium]|uniref:Beta-ketoadipate enol-lactone hydrolase n=1 Tax=uncultured Solirubrobacterales bacterium TaxID=768556 RepID=A0A6J4S708_9ACTN|nr:MAG: Beta-ketoadipate enol-lactone hydrolase [uncultured Solirubrobacterales bacterium]
MEGASAQANGIELVYDGYGDPADPTVLMIMGLGTPRWGYDEELCRLIADRGFHVVRFDNRDIGDSTHLHDAPAPDLEAALGGDVSSASYRLEDMADDAAGLLDALRVESAHVVGVSMGGMIAQTLVIRHPERVRSLISIMSTVAPWVGPPREDILGILLAPPASDQPGHERQVLDTWKAIRSPGFPFHEDRVRELARRVWEAGYDPPGVARQLIAIQASGDRTEALRRVDVPTVVIHGDCDPLVQHPGGVATAEAIAGAELDTITGMGHDLPVELFERFAERIAELASRADAEAVAAAR